MLKAYASYFVAYLLNNMKYLEEIERIILFGSVARGDSTNESDIDLFIEVKKKTKKLESEIKDIENNFYQSREASLFKVKGINNSFSIKIGNLKEWKDLYKSIASTGIVLYGHYEAKEIPSGMRYGVIIFWNKIGENRGAFLNKIYGFSANKKYYPGLIEKYDGKKIGKSCILIPIQFKDEIIKLLKKYKVEGKVIEMFY